MHLRKAICSEPVNYRWQRSLTVAFAFVVTSILLIGLTAYNTACGQAPELVPSEISIIEATGEYVSEIQLDTIVEIAPGTDLIQDESLYTPFEEQACDCLSGPQTIRLRKNVLGCKATYSIPETDEVWIVSARANSCDTDNVDLFEVKKLTNNVWQPSSLSELTETHQCDTSRSTLLYVHGNQTNYEYGVARGFQFYNNLFIEYDCPRPPMRIVLWLWKSEREQPRLYSDYLVKSERAVRMGRTLTKTLEAFGDRRIAVTGFSLGAQVIMSSMEEMEPNCRCATSMMGDDKYQIALIAPATDPAYICDVINRNVESSIVGMSTIIVNKNDRAVKAMRVVVRRECPEARDMFSELAREHHFPLGPMEFFEVSKEVSKKHAIERYTKSLTIKRAMNKVLTRVGTSSY